MMYYMGPYSKQKAAGMVPAGTGVNTGIPDPINALQNLARQGTTNPQTQMDAAMGVPQQGNVGIGMTNQQTGMPTGQMQIGPQVVMQTQQGQGNQGVPSGIAPNHLQQRLQVNRPGPPTLSAIGISGPQPLTVTNQMGQVSGPMPQMGGQMPQLSQQLQQPRKGWQVMTGNEGSFQGKGSEGGIPQTTHPTPTILQQQLTQQYGHGTYSQHGPQQQQHPQQQQLQQNEAMMMGQAGQSQPAPQFSGPNVTAPRQGTPTHFKGQSPNPVPNTNSVPSPATGTLPIAGSLPPSTAMVNSPAFASSPSSGMLQSPAAPGSGAGTVGAPSPSSLNTPAQAGSAGPTSSPRNAQEDQTYLEKVRQLSKYIEPLRRMIAKIGDDDTEKLGKMKKLLDILSNPNKRMPIETLLKCEVVLEKLELKKDRSEVSTTAIPTQIFYPLLEAVMNQIKSPYINHTLQRTFGPPLEALFGPEIKMPPPPKVRRIEEPTSEISDVLQGEIARLDQRFKVSIDPAQHHGLKAVHLVCQLDDKNLPCVPPISIAVPEDYPQTSPCCNTSAQDYDCTQFLQSVQSALMARISKLPNRFSVSQLLDTWEMSVRQACSPKPVTVTPTLVALGL